MRERQLGCRRGSHRRRRRGRRQRGQGLVVALDMYEDDRYVGYAKRTGDFTLLASLGCASKERVLNGRAAAGALAVCVCHTAVGAGEGGDEAGDLLSCVLVGDAICDVPISRSRSSCGHVGSEVRSDRGQERKGNIQRTGGYRSNPEHQRKRAKPRRRGR